MWNHWKSQKVFQMHLEVHLPIYFKAIDKNNMRQLVKLLMEILGTSSSNKSQNNALPFLTLDIFPTLLTSQTQAVNWPMRNVLASWSISYTELFWACCCRNLVGSFRKKPWKEIIFMHCQWSEKQSLGAKDNTANWAHSEISRLSPQTAIDGLNKQLQTLLNEYHCSTNPSFLNVLLIWSKCNLLLLIPQPLLAQHHTHSGLQCALWLMKGFETKAQ